MMKFSGPMAEPAKNENFVSQFGKQGGHYNLFRIEGGMRAIRDIFPDGRADALNLFFCGTSGVHGTYATIEEIESALAKYGDDATFAEGEWPEDHHDELTVVIVHPRLCTLRYGNVRVTMADIPYLKKLRASSWEAAQTVGKQEAA